jgi:cell division protein FtsB
MSLRLLGVSALVGIAIVLAAFGATGLLRVSQLQGEIRGLEDELRTQQEKSERLTELVNCLRSDPACIEKVAREELGMVREDETVLKLPSGPPTPSSSSAPLPSGPPR